LRGRHVVILPDNDEPGRKHSEQVASSLHNIAASVRIVTLPDLPPKGDVCGWLNAGGTLEQLQRIVEEANSISSSDSSILKEATKGSGIIYESATELIARDFPEPKWAVEGLLSEGATVFAGSPKVGKSFLALGLAIAIASGGRALGSIPVEQGDVLYAALEDGDRRMKKRLLKILDSSIVPDSLTFAYKFPRIDDGGLEALRRWLREHPNARLIIIDTLKRVRPQENRVKRIYDGDYDAVSPLNDLAQEYGVSILIIHHTNKLTSNDDWFDSISGSLGLSGAVDNAMLLRRPRGQQKGTLYVGGRDIEDRELAVQFDNVISGWKLLGDALSDLAQKIESWLLEAGQAGLCKSDINKRNGGRSEGVTNALAELKTAGRAKFKTIPTTGKAQERWLSTALSSEIADSADDNDDIDDKSQEYGIAA
jgi:hypothetical protein